MLRILLGAQLRRLREAKRISLEEAGNVIRASHSKISRLETGRVGFKDRDIADLLTFYGVTDENDRQALRELAAPRQRAGLVARLLRHPAELVRGVRRARGGGDSDPRLRGAVHSGTAADRRVRPRGHAARLPERAVREIDRRVGLRLARQVVFTRPTPPNIWVVLDEAVLRRPIGGAEVMRAQIRHLIELAQRPNVTIQIVPFHAGGHAAAGGPFSILRFAEYDLPDVVYLEQLTSALYLDKQEIVDSYLMVMDRLCVEATTPAASIKMMRTLLKDL